MRFRSNVPVLVAIVVAALLALAALGACSQQPAVEEVTVPSVITMDKAAAEAALATIGFTSQVTTETTTAPVGQVVNQTPAANTKAAKGTAIALIVSAGPPAPPQATVPDVVGLKSVDARKKIKEYGLTYFVEHQVSSKVAAGTVMSQAIPPGKSVPKGTQVKLEVSSGPATIEVPNVVGLSESAAKAKITSKGFKVKTASVHSSGTPKGLVMDQSPNAGEDHTKGSTVHITVSLGPKAGPTATVPQVVGTVEAAGAEELRMLGFIPIVQTRADPTAQSGEILDQSPEAGTVLPKGSNVTIIVATPGLYQ